MATHQTIQSIHERADVSTRARKQGRISADGCAHVPKSTEEALDLIQAGQNHCILNIAHTDQTIQATDAAFRIVALIDDPATALPIVEKHVEFGVTPFLLHPTHSWKLIPSAPLEPDDELAMIDLLLANQRSRNQKDADRFKARMDALDESSESASDATTADATTADATAADATAADATAADATAADATAADAIAADATAADAIAADATAADATAADATAADATAADATAADATAADATAADAPAADAIAADATAADATAADATAADACSVIPTTGGILDPVAVPASRDAFAVIGIIQEPELGVIINVFAAFPSFSLAKRYTKDTAGEADTEGYELFVVDSGRWIYPSALLTKRDNIPTGYRHKILDDVMRYKKNLPGMIDDYKKTCGNMGIEPSSINLDLSASQ